MNILYSYKYGNNCDGAIVNALAFSGNNYLFSTLRESNAKEVKEERKRHNKALEQLEAAKSQWRD